MTICAIDTSCDETSVAITQGRKILANCIYSQIILHKKWGGVVPSIAKRAHEERIDSVIKQAIKKAIRTKLVKNNSKPFDYIAVTYGPGLAIALEVGIKKSEELANRYKIPIIPVNHMEGHIYSVFAQNSKGNPRIPFVFPYLALLVSGGHTELVLFKDHLCYSVIGSTIDDAAGEALDKSEKMLGLGYPGGPIIEKLALLGDKKFISFPRPMQKPHTLDFSYSGLKTAMYYYLKDKKQNFINKNIANLSASYQEAVFDSLIYKLEHAINKTNVKNIIVAGGVVANNHLRNKIRKSVYKKKGSVLFPTINLTGDNAAMIGIAGYYKARNEIYIQNDVKLDRQPRASL